MGALPRKTDFGQGYTVRKKRFLKIWEDSMLEKESIKSFPTLYKIFLTWILGNLF